MNQRITEAMVERVVKRINEQTGNAIEPYTGGIPNVGCYMVQGAYDGYQLQQLDEHGSRAMFGGGYVKRPLLYELCKAFLEGIQAAHESKMLTMGKD